MNAAAGLAEDFQPAPDGLIATRADQVLNEAVDLLVEAGAWDDVREIVAEVCEVGTPLVAPDVLATWLHRIALNLSRNRYWYFYRRRRHATVSLDSTFSDENRATFSDLVASDDAGPARETVTSEFSELVTRCMAQLGDRPREILVLRNSLNRSYGEIATQLGINVGTVKSRIARARESLRVLLTQACPEFSTDAQPSTWLDPVRRTAGKWLGRLRQKSEDSDVVPDLQRLRYGRRETWPEPRAVFKRARKARPVR